MRLFQFPIKSTYVSWWRSLTLAVFIFFISFVLVTANSFVYSSRRMMQVNLSNALCGDIQIRPAASSEKDMINMSGAGSDEVHSIKAPMAEKIRSILEEMSLEPAGHIRASMLLLTDARQEPAPVIGIGPDEKHYKKSYILKQGRFLEKGNDWEIVLATDIAGALGVKPGDKVAALSQTREGYTVDAEFTVVGTGNVQTLDLFGINLCYISQRSAEYLMGFERGEVSDILAYSKGNNLDSQTEVLTGKLNRKKITTIGLRSNADRTKDVRITNLENMGGYIMSIVGILSATLYGFIISLMLVVSIMIINLVLMMGIERYKEIGTLRALGFSRFRIIRLFISEILFITAQAGAVGFGLGLIFVYVFGKIGVPAPGQSFVYYMGERLYLKHDIISILPFIFILFLFSFLASFIPALKISSLKPAETVREN